MVSTQQLFVWGVRDLSSDARPPHVRTADPTCTTYLRSDGLVCYSRSDLGTVDRHHRCVHTPHLARPLVSLPFFVLDVPLLHRCRMKANSITNCREDPGEKPPWLGRSASEAFCSISQRGGAFFVHKLDHQLLSGEATATRFSCSPRVVRPKMTSFFCPRSSELATLGLKDARGPQRKRWLPQTKPGPSPRFSWCRCVFFGGKTRKVPMPQMQEDGVEAV